MHDFQWRDPMGVSPRLRALAHLTVGEFSALPFQSEDIHDLTFDPNGSRLPPSPEVRAYIQRGLTLPVVHVDAVTSELAQLVLESAEFDPVSDEDIEDASSRLDSLNDHANEGMLSPRTYTRLCAAAQEFESGLFVVRGSYIFWRDYDPLKDHWDDMSPLGLASKLVGAPPSLSVAAAIFFLSVCPAKASLLRAIGRNTPQGSGIIKHLNSVSDEWVAFLIATHSLDTARFDREDSDDMRALKSLMSFDFETCAPYFELGIIDPATVSELLLAGPRCESALPYVEFGIHEPKRIADMIEANIPPDFATHVR